MAVDVIVGGEGGEIRCAIVVGNHQRLIWGADIVAGQSVSGFAVVDRNTPGAIGHVHRVIAIGVGVHMLIIIHAIDGRVGQDPHTDDGVATVILEVAGDVIVGGEGGEIRRAVVVGNHHRLARGTDIVARQTVTASAGVD